MTVVPDLRDERRFFGKPVEIPRLRSAKRTPVARSEHGIGRGEEGVPLAALPEELFARRYILLLETLAAAESCSAVHIFK